MRNISGMYRILIVLVLYVLVLPSFAGAQQSEEEKNFLLMYFKEEELQVVSSTRSIKSIAKVAENMTVVTAAEIERMNAHTLAEVLNTINGVQVWFNGTAPGNMAFVQIQGSDARHVTVFIDGVIQNNLSSNQAFAELIPVQNIEKIEIVKGPGSSVWGSALGGVVNIITKSPPAKGIHGTVSTSYGSNNTEDFRAEVRARAGDAGLYLTAGQIHSNGFIDGTTALSRNLYTKATYNVLRDTVINLSLSYTGARQGTGDWAEDFGVKEKARVEDYFGTLSVSSRLTNSLTLDVAGNMQRNRRYVIDHDLNTGADIPMGLWDDRRYGSSAKLVWKTEYNTVVFGADYDHGTEKSTNLLDGRQYLIRWSAFANDTISIGNFAITPGVRYEDTNQNGNFISPSLGATYLLAKKTILRATVARGFNIPALGDTFGTGGGFPNPNLEVEKVMSYQVSAESGELKYVWIKVSLFRHDLKDVLAMIDTDGDGFVDKTVNQGRQRRQGFEAELRTMPVYNTTLSAGTTYISAKDRDTNEVIPRIPKYTYDAALSYDDNKSFKAQLKGRYVWWNAEDWLNSKYSNFIVDLSAAKTLYTHADQKLEVFLTAHNLLNANQYVGNFYRNAGRWAEGGIRYKF
jgi:vitamin B12 transporter